MKKLKHLIYIINIKLILLDICLLIFIILILCFSFLNKTKGETTPVIDTTPVGKTIPTEPAPVIDTRRNQNKISLSSMKELTNEKIYGVPYLKFKLPDNLYNDLETDTLRRKTEEEKTIIFNNVENFMINFVKGRINEKILEINNSLTKKDYDITFIEPNSMRKHNPIYKSIAMDFTIEGKNKATGQIIQKLTVDVSIYGNNYN